MASRFFSFVSLAGSVALMSLSVAGCSADIEVERPIEVPMSAPDGIAVGFEDYYSQGIVWGECEPEQIVLAKMPQPDDMALYECSTLQAPMSWDDPESAPIELVIARHTGINRNKNLPPLFFNLGGPGGESVANLVTFVENVLTKQMADQYQVVAIDPRGVGQSSPIWCLTDEERDKNLAETIDTSNWTVENRITYLENKAVELGTKCLERNGAILGFVDTDSVTRDFDMVRANMGAPQIDYLGFSYGTYIGSMYADLFPKQVRRIALDSADDMSLGVNETGALQLQGLENSIYHWIEECQKNKKCPFDGDLESGKQQLIDFMEATEKNPIPTSDPDRPLNVGFLETAMVGAMYNEDMFPILTEAMRMAMNGDGSSMMVLADYFNDRNEDGVYTNNSADAIIAVNMLDYEPSGTPEEWKATYEEAVEKFPIMAPFMGIHSAGLEQWPVKSRVERRTPTAKGVDEILVIGTTNDPATPYVMAKNLANNLEGGILVTVEGWTHGAYNRDASDCIVDVVDNFFLENVTPTEGLTCMS